MGEFIGWLMIGLGLVCFFSMVGYAVLLRSRMLGATSPRPSPPSDGGEGVRPDAERPRSGLATNNPFGVVIAESEPAWLDVDREVWRKFLMTETGKRLRARMHYYEQGQNRKACLLMDALAAARAAGFHDSCAWIEAHAADVDAGNNDDNNQSASGVRGLVERHRP